MQNIVQEILVSKPKQEKHFYGAGFISSLSENNGCIEMGGAGVFTFTESKLGLCDLTIAGLKLDDWVTFAYSGNHHRVIRFFSLIRGTGVRSMQSPEDRIGCDEGFVNLS